MTRYRYRTHCWGKFRLPTETPGVTSSNPVLRSDGYRAIQLGLKIIF